MSGNNDGRGEKVVEHDYILYGPEWEKQLMKHTKPELIAMYRRLCLQKYGGRNGALILSEAGYYDMIGVIWNTINDVEQTGEVSPNRIDEMNEVLKKYKIGE